MEERQKASEPVTKRLLDCPMGLSSTFPCDNAIVPIVPLLFLPQAVRGVIGGRGNFIILQTASLSSPASHKPNKANKPPLW